MNKVTLIYLLTAATVLPIVTYLCIQARRDRLTIVRAQITELLYHIQAEFPDRRLPLIREGMELAKELWWLSPHEGRCLKKRMQQEMLTYTRLPIRRRIS
jgi:hypothetical protein